MEAPASDPTSASDDARPPLRIVVLGAGFGGLELTTRLSEAVADDLGADVDVVLIDRTDGFVFGFSKLDVLFGKTRADRVHHAYADLVKPGVRFVQATIDAIDPVAKRVETDAGSFEADILVVALGADLDPAATPGLVEDGHEFYTEAGAFAAADVLAAFDGGRVIVGVTSTPFKCPPAPSETALLLHDFLLARGLREQSEIALVMPMGVPIPPSPDASAALLVAFEERGIAWQPGTTITGLDAARHVAVTADGSELPYDLFLGVPVHRVPAVVEASGLAVDGWIPVDSLTLETSFPDVYAVGDVTSVGTPKAGIFAEGQAAVVADRIIERVRRAGPGSAQYDGHGLCYMDMGQDQVAKVDVTFLSGQAPVGYLEGPSTELAADKAVFGTIRVKRWFDRDWQALD